MAARLMTESRLGILEDHWSWYLWMDGVRRLSFKCNGYSCRFPGTDVYLRLPKLVSDRYVILE